MTDRSARRGRDATVLHESRDSPERFADLFDTYHAEIYRYVASRLGVAYADDLAAETFLVAFRGRAGFSGPDEHVRAWLYGIATNLIRRQRRDEQRRYRALGRAGAVVTGAGDDHDDRVVARVTALGVQRDLAGALRSLKPGDRDVLLLVALAGLNYAEVAAALGIPQGTVGSRLNRARAAVRAALGGADPTRDQPSTSNQHPTRDQPMARDQQPVRGEQPIIADRQPVRDEQSTRDTGGHRWTT